MFCRLWTFITPSYAPHVSSYGCHFSSKLSNYSRPTLSMLVVRLMMTHWSSLGRAPSPGFFLTLQDGTSSFSKLIFGMPFLKKTKIFAKRILLFQNTPFSDKQPWNFGIFSLGHLFVLLQEQIIFSKGMYNFFFFLISFSHGIYVVEICDSTGSANLLIPKNKPTKAWAPLVSTRSHV